MPDIYWVRHAPTHEKAFVGWRDVPADLSDKAQIGRLSRALPRNALLVSSDLSRACATADAIAVGQTRLPAMKSLREFDFGAWDGMRFDDVADRDPILSRKYWEEPGDLRAPDGESWNDVAKRVGHAVDGLLQAHPGRDVIAVAHIGVIMTQIARCGGTAYQAMGHQIDNLSVTQLQVSGAGWTAKCINHKP